MSSLTIIWIIKNIVLLLFINIIIINLILLVKISDKLVLIHCYG